MLRTPSVVPWARCPNRIEGRVGRHLGPWGKLPALRRLSGSRRPAYITVRSGDEGRGRRVARGQDYRFPNGAKGPGRVCLRVERRLPRNILSWLRLYWAWMLDNQVQWKHPKEALERLPISHTIATLPESMPPSIAATDCKSLFDLVTRNAPPNCAEFRTQLHARAIKDLISEGVSMRWVHSGAQLADSLTKVMSTAMLRETLAVGKYCLSDETEILKERSTRRDRIKWLRDSTRDSTNPHYSESLQNSK